MKCPDCEIYQYNDTLHKLRQNVWVSDKKKLEHIIVQLRKQLRTEVKDIQQAINKILDERI